MISKLISCILYFPASIGTRFHISKYPTLKAVRNGQLFKKEYRGQRSADAFATFIREQLVDPVKEYASVVELDSLDDKKRNAIGYFESRESAEYLNFARVAAVLKDDCSFHAGFGEVTRMMHPPEVLRRDVRQPAKSVSVKTRKSAGACQANVYTNLGESARYCAIRRRATRSFLVGSFMRRHSSFAGKARSGRSMAG